MTVRLFVYGSLKKGHVHHERISRATFECATRTAFGFRLVYYGGYPALVAGGGGSVEGEVYRVTLDLLEALDEFEGCPDLYERGAVLLEDGSVVTTYRIPPERAENCDEIPSGRWLG